MRTLRICVYGIVQGVGFRPFISRIADRIGIKGSVANRGSYVEIFACGEDAALDEFIDAIELEAPPRSEIIKVISEDITEASVQNGEHIYDDFQIIESTKESGDIYVSPDIATCPECRRELFDPSNRRYLHPFINCTACGPRLTILDSMPYDRERTSMGEFPMCPECEFEYTHAETRRYDAQPVCCNDCGPELYIIGTDIRGRDAIIETRKAIIGGKIIAIKGIGGFHLCCDATSENAVARLRALKRRPAKPFAIMARDIDSVDRICDVPGDGIREILDGHKKPIVLLHKKADADNPLAPSVAPDNPKVGVMLPYAPVQMLIFDYDDGLDIGTDYLVMTSGNVSGAPICRSDEDAISEIADFCDIILSNNRKIRLRADDSVMDVYKGELYMIRRSRGYAPLPVVTENDIHASVLAVGGELKNTFCIGKDRLFYESPYVGDMGDVRTVRALDESIDRMAELLETEPTIVASDLHPRYNTTVLAEDYAHRKGISHIKIQHHYAHILSCMAENDYLDEVIGLSMDGTGYGLDGTIWGGEILRCSLDGFERLASISPFNQVGGDISAKEGWRIAASMINTLYGDKAPDVCERLGLCKASDCKLIGAMASKGINSVVSTSAGRLFDAVSAILGIRRASSFEGEAATTLQFRAMEVARTLRYDGDTSPRNGVDGILRTDELVKWLIDKKIEHFRDISAEEIEESNEMTLECELAYAFHDGFARMLVDAAIMYSRKTGIDTIALSGGVMQNTLLLEMIEEGLAKSGLNVIRHHLIPPNDGGIALGQALYASWEVSKCV